MSLSEIVLAFAAVHVGLVMSVVHSPRVGLLTAALYAAFFWGFVL